MIDSALEDAARKAWGSMAHSQRWTLWGRLSWATPVSEFAASRMLEEWTQRMHDLIPGMAMMVGIHGDTERRHAHVLIYVPNRIVNILDRPGIGFIEWCWPAWLSLEWKHGQVWAEWFSRKKSEEGSQSAAEYLARFPGTVMQYGKAPPARHPATQLPTTA